MEHDVIVFDQEYANAAQMLLGYVKELIEKIDAYETSISEILTTAILDQEIAAGLRDLQTKVKPIKTSLQKVGATSASTGETYVSEVDTADRFLY
ncbi:MAG: hypothetical protein PUH12_03855 [Lachnospiraceae bacterium]|nr:hypothetical protein [Lachnospiraceae bacterium]